MLASIVNVGCANKPDEVIAKAARAAAVNTVVGVTRAVLDASSQVATQANLAQLTSGIASVDTTGAAPQAKARQQALVRSLERLNSTPGAATALGVMALGAATTTTTNSPTLDDQLAELLDALLQNPTTEGGVTVYHPDAGKLCADDLICKSRLTHVTVTLVTTSDDAGTLTIKYDAHAPFTLGYAPNRVYFESDIGEAAAIASEIFSAEGTGQTVEGAGKSRVTLRVTGAQAAEVVSGVTQAIHFQYTNGQESLTLDIASADDGFRMAVDAVAKTGLIQLNYGAIGWESKSLVPVQSSIGATGPTLQVLQTDAGGIDKITAKVELSEANGAHTLHVTGVSLGATGFVTSTNGVEMASAKVDAEELTIVTNAQTTTLTFTKSLTLTMTNKTEETKLAATAGTVLTWDATQHLFRVTAGRFEFSITDSTITNKRVGSLAVAEDGCFKWGTAGFPFVNAPCA
ncbi:MAG: hypothetical protein AABY83_02140 [Pseudomonadota bacterium]